MKRFRNVAILLLSVFFTLSNKAIAEEPMCITMKADAVSINRGQHNLLCYRVITSYSIHYTKLYDYIRLAV